MGLFVGLISQPYKTTTKESISYFDLLFENYKKKIDEVSEEDINPALYKPQYYFLLGHFDLATIALVDDFVFGQQKFKPFSEVTLYYPKRREENKKEEYYHFNYQVNNTTIIDANIEDIRSSKKFMLFSQLKIKSSLLISDNIEAEIIKETEFFTRVAKLINGKLEKTNKASKEVEYILSRSVGWSEFDLILFSDDAKKLNQTFLLIREFVCTPDFFRGNSFYEILCGKNSVPLFSFTYSYLGISNNASEGERVDLLKNLNLITKFYLKPGSLNAFAKDSDSFILGSGDLIKGDINKTDIPETLAIRDFEREHFIRKTNSIAYFELDKSEFEEADYKSLNIEQIAEHLGVAKYINFVDHILLQLKVEKNLRIRILKMLNNFHDAITDSLLYIYFIELHPLITSIIRYISFLDEKYSSNILIFTLEEIQNKLTEFTDIFEHSYRSRMQHSSRTLDLTDTTLEYNGGIQQLLSAYDILFKQIRQYLRYYNSEYEGASNYTLEDCTSTTYITSSSGITSNRLALRVNYIYLAQPEFFIATLGKEALNGIIDQKFHLTNSGSSPLSLKDVYDFVKNKPKFELPTELISITEKDPSLIEFYKIKKFFSLLNLNETQVINKIKKHLLNEIQKLSTLTTHQKWEYWEFVTLLNHRFFEYLVYDYLNVYYFYKNDYELYFFWCWNLFFQERMHYETDGLLKSDYFNRLLLRCLFLIDTIEDKKRQEDAKSYCIGIIKKYTIAAELYKIHGENIQDFFDLLTNNAKDLKTSPCNEIFHFSYFKNYLKHHNSIEWVRLIKFQDVDLNIIQKQMLEFLKASKDASGKNEHIIYRDLSTGKVLKNIKNGKIKDGLYFDSAGGLFLTGKERAKYFTRRDDLMSFLINNSNKFKYNYLVKIFKKK